MSDDLLGQGQEHSTAEDVEFLSQDEKEETKETTEEVEKEVEEPKEEEKEEVEEVPEETEDEKNLIKERPSYKEILTAKDGKYKDLFKDFPDLKEMYFRENEYTKIFSSVEDAKEAAEENERFTAADEMICEGTVEGTSKFLGFMKESDKEVYSKHVDNFLPALAKSDPDKHYEILLPIAENLFRTLYEEGTRTGNKNLANAALHASNYYFGSPEIASGQKSISRQRNSDVDEARASFDREKEEFYAQQYNKAVEQVEVIITGTLNKEISKGLEGLSSGLTKILAKEVIGEVDRAIVNDRDFVGKRDSLWKNARKYGYSKESLDRIISAYLSRARQLMPAIRTKIRSEAMANKTEQIEKEKSKESRRELSGGGQQRFGSKSYSPKQVDYSKTSDMDILNDNVTMRR